MIGPVKLTADPDVATWLGQRPATEWNAGNRSKSEAKHGFSIAEVDSLLDAPVLFAGRIVEPAHEELRYLLLGVTKDGRRAALIFARRGETLRPISCRAMRKKEKEAYDAGA
jgi:uncharacterized DUF497 family protein